MTKLILSNLGNLQNESTTLANLAANNAATVTAMENTISRDGTSPNTMLSDLDMNSHTFLNLPTPILAGDAVRKDYGDTNYGPAALAIANVSVAAAAASAATATTQAGVATTQAGISTMQATNSLNAYNATVGIIGDQYVYSSTTASADPGSGKFRLNNATLNSVTAMYISETDNLGNALAAWIATWDDSTSTNKAVLTIEKLSAPTTVWHQYFITGSNTDNGIWDTINLTNIGGTGSFTDTDVMVLAVNLIGNKGADGTGVGDMVSNTATSVANEIALFADTTGKSFKRSTGSGLAKLTSGVLSTATASTDYIAATTGSAIQKASSGGLTAAVSATDYAPATTGTSILKASSGGFANAVAGTDYLAPAAIGTTVQAFDVQLTSNIPINSQSAAYGLVLTDGEKAIYHPSADTTARIWTIPANASVAYPVGTALTFINDTSGGVITIAITTDTLVLAGTGSTGSRTLAANGMATAIKMTSTRWMINGTGLT